MQNENGVLAVQEDFGNALVDKYAPVWDKKYRSKGESIWVFQRRLGGCSIRCSCTAGSSTGSVRAATGGQGKGKQSRKC